MNGKPQAGQPLDSSRPSTPITAVCCRKTRRGLTACGQDAPAPSNIPSSHRANHGPRDSLDIEETRLDVRRNHHSKTAVVVTVVRLVVVAILGARVVLIVVPRAAAQHASTHPGSPCCCQPYDDTKKFRAALRATGRATARLYRLKPAPPFAVRGKCRNSSASEIQCSVLPRSAFLDGRRNHHSKTAEVETVVR